MCEYTNKDWIWLLSLILKYNQSNNNHNKNEIIEFWNWAVTTYQPENMPKLDEE